MCALLETHRRRVRQEELCVTTATTTGQAGVYRCQEGIRGKDTGRIMTDAAFGIRRYMVGNLTGGYTRVMALRTVVRIDTKVVIQDPGKAGVIIDVVTTRAVFGRRHMVNRFADSNSIVMTQRTIICIYTHMVKGCRDESCGVMAGTTVGGGRQVADALAYAECPVMTAVTAASAGCVSTVVIHHPAGEGAGRMTDTAIINRDEVKRWIIGSRLVRRIGSRVAMARNTVIHPAGMVEITDLGEIHGIVAGATVRSCDGMAIGSRAFTRRIDAVVIVMTGFAGLDNRIDPAMVEYTVHTETGNIMTHRAIYIDDGMTRDGACRNGIVMATVAAFADHIGASMVRKSILKT